MSPLPKALRAALILAAIGSAACGPGAVTSELAKAPDFDPKGQTKCGVAKSQAEPLIVEWPDAARGKLESQVKKSVVVVRYIGCDMRVLGQCSAPGKYGYASLNPKKSRVKMHNADELYANIPAYAVKFEGTLARAGELNVEMTIVGRYEADRSGVRVEDLQGDCEGATHVVTGLSVGAFEFFAGAGAKAGVGVAAGDIGAGAKSSSLRETLNADGQEAACKGATGADTIPPYGCGALLGLEVQPIVGAQPVAPPVVVSAPREAAPVDEAPRAPASGGQRFRRDVGTSALRDASTGLLWTRAPQSGDHYDAKRACMGLRLGAIDRALPGRVDRSLLAQDAAPVSESGWRLPSAGELNGFVAAASSAGAIAVDASDCFWVDDDAGGSIARRTLLGQAAPASTCVTASGARKQLRGDASFFCVKSR